MLAHLSSLTGKDLAQFDFDEPLLNLTTNSAQSTLAAIMRAVPPESSLRDLHDARAKTASETMVGSGRDVAEEMRVLVEETGADGLLLRGSFWPEKVSSITELLVPELRKAGLIRTAYASNNLRENLVSF